MPKEPQKEPQQELSAEDRDWQVIAKFLDGGGTFQKEQLSEAVMTELRAREGDAGREERSVAAVVTKALVDLVHRLRGGEPASPEQAKTPDREMDR